MSYYDSDALTMIARKLIIRRFRNGMFNGLNRTDGEDVLLKVILLHLHRKMYGCKCSNVPIKVRQCEQTRAMARSKLFVRANATKTLKISDRNETRILLCARMYTTTTTTATVVVVAKNNPRLVSLKSRYCFYCAYADVLTFRPEYVLLCSACVLIASYAAFSFCSFMKMARSSSVLTIECDWPRK